jgi:hypothetical protein
LKRRVGQLHLALDSGCACDPELSRRLDCVPEQRRLANARLAADDQDSAVSAARGIQQPVEHLALPLPAKQLRSWHRSQ